MWGSDCGQFRYGLIGLNGSGKSAMLTALGRRLVPIPEHISMYHVDQEAQPSEVTALDTVLADLDEEVQKLEAEYEELCETDPDSDRCQEICDRLDLLDPELAPARAGKILFGLGFDADRQNTKCKEFSGGWRMRVALARALFVAPDLLIIEDPTRFLLFDFRYLFLSLFFFHSLFSVTWIWVLLFGLRNI